MTVTSKSLGNSIKWSKESQQWIAADCDIDQWRCKACREYPKQIQLPADIATFRKNRLVTIDNCITDDVKMLWKNGIQTLSVCCGHQEEEPSVVIDSKYTDKEIKGIVKLLETTGREYEIFQWRLIEEKTRYKGKRKGEQKLELVGKVWVYGKGGR